LIFSDAEVGLYHDLTYTIPISMKEAYNRNARTRFDYEFKQNM